VQAVSISLVLVVLLAFGVLVALPAVPLLIRATGPAGRLGRTIALCGGAFFATWCVVPLFTMGGNDLALNMTMFALYGAMIEAVCVAVAAIVASYGTRATR
jgi:hypothetical protein